MMRSLTPDQASQRVSNTIASSVSGPVDPSYCKSSFSYLSDVSRRMPRAALVTPKQIPNPLCYEFYDVDRPVAAETSKGHD